jgi:branched-subunit amino acid aminotransferase/4-amino-4-deoxychorismate lyase
MEPLAYLHGRLLPAKEAALPLHDAGFVLGATVTDLCRTFAGRLYRWAEHCARFRQSCRLARVALPYSDEELTDLAQEIARNNRKCLPGGGELALVVFATPGPIGYYLGQTGGAGQDAPTLGMYTYPLPFVRLASLFRPGARLLVPSVRQVPAVCVDPRIKQRSRLFWWLAEQEVHDLDPGASALLLDMDGLVTETAAANFLLVRQGQVLTPRRTRVLGGISLQVVEQLCAGLGLPFAEADLTLEDCRSADEAMLSGTSFCLAPVHSIQGTPLPCPGPIYQKLAGRWSEHLGLDFREQILQGSL